MRGVRARRLLEVRTGNAGTKKHYVSKPWRRGEEEGKSALSRTFTLKCPSLTLSKNRGSHDDAFLLESGCVAGAGVEEEDVPESKSDVPGSTADSRKGT